MDYRLCVGMDRQTLNRIVDAVRDRVSRLRLDWRHGAAAGAVVLLGLGVLGLGVLGLMRATGGDAVADIPTDQRIRIEVVQPVEPELIAGPVMEVGTLVDAFQPGDLPPATPAVSDEEVEPADTPKESTPLLRRFSRIFGSSAPRHEKPAPPEIRREDRAYGFDAPRPDWEAERDARRARRERVEAERRDREMRQRMTDDRDHAPSDASSH